MTDPDLYYGPPTADNYCAFQYRVVYTKRPGEPMMPIRRCPHDVDFYVKTDDGRSYDMRKARAACAEHLASVIWQLQDDSGGEGGYYTGRYIMTAAIMELAAKGAESAKKRQPDTLSQPLSNSRRILACHRRSATRHEPAMG